MPSNPLTNLLEQYNSESDDEDGQQLNPKNKNERLDKKVDDFLKEIQDIAPNNSEDGSNNETHKNVSLWQECFDESSGYPYYWHTQTNQVTWEIPKELELNREETNQNTPQTSVQSMIHGVQRSHLAGNTYNKTLEQLPEGMIPKEVVERCKNRYRNKKQKVSKVQNKRQVSNHNSKESDSDDGPIEMITSFGSDGSESEDNDEKKLKSPNVPVNNDSKELINNVDCKRQELKDRSSLPQVHIKSSAQDNSVDNDNDKNDNTMKNNRKFNEEQRIKFSLVPGYADDSDNDDDESVGKNQRKTLFPISEFDDNNLLAKKFKGQNSLVSTIDATIDDKKLKIDEINVKSNKLLETSEAPSKAFQRKRRIAFDVRPKNDPKIIQNELNNDNQIHPDVIRGNDERLGFGFSKNSNSLVDHDDNNTNTNDSDEKSIESEKNENTIAFVKGEILNLPQVFNEKNESEKIIMKQEIEMILEKLKFLSEGFQTISAVQIMTIQLQTLLTAWEASDLRDRYLDNWLSGTSSELCRLEKAAAPSGWSCQWDRSHKRYYYQNESTGETRWNYPDVIGGAEEMELCTTPPPMDNEIDEIEDNNMMDNQILDASKSDLAKGGEQTPDNDTDATKSADSNDLSKRMVPPPPPKISSPSPPPPPRINAEDLKKGRKQKTNCETEKVNNDDKTVTKTIETSMAMPTLVGTEPLPPGVDSPEISFPLTGTHQSIEPTVLFATTQQPTNQPSMYATATIQDPTSVSIIGPHHPALLQSQLVHYPAYHQHLHNQAIIAAANRLTGQDTVQFVLDFPRIYTNTQVIAKPPITTNKESLGLAINSFYNDIASLERPTIDEQPKPVQSPQMITVEPQSVAPTISDISDKSAVIGVDNLAYKDKRKKKMKNLVGKKQKQVSSMVAKWQKAQNYE